MGFQEKSEAVRKGEKATTNPETCMGFLITTPGCVVADCF